MPDARAVFSPDPATRARFLDDCASPDLSLRELAQQYRITIEAAAAFIAEHTTRASLDLIESAALRRVRLTSLTHLPRAIDALLWTLINAGAESANELPAKTPREQSLRERKRENIRRATNLMLRLSSAHFSQDARAAAPVPHSDSQSQRSAPTPSLPEACDSSNAPIPTTAPTSVITANPQSAAAAVPPRSPAAALLSTLARTLIHPTPPPFVRESLHAVPPTTPPPGPAPAPETLPKRPPPGARPPSPRPAPLTARAYDAGVL